MIFYKSISLLLDSMNCEFVEWNHTTIICTSIWCRMGDSCWLLFEPVVMVCAPHFESLRMGGNQSVCMLYAFFSQTIPFLSESDRCPLDSCKQQLFSLWLCMNKNIISEPHLVRWSQATPWYTNKEFLMIAVKGSPSAIWKYQMLSIQTEFRRRLFWQWDWKFKRKL